ncbi:MAG TPA: MFS transporter [Gemmataceae bacterium]|jgi:MFS family permease|nr:MFS transporter [Gemmataceae bacterium]
MPDDSRPTHARVKLAVWLCGLSAVLYLDRICMSQAIKPIQQEFKLSNSEMSAVMMAFTLAYGLFEIPTGRLGDKYGSRAVLTRIVIWWSIFTALTGACSGLISLIIVRFIFGAGEAGAFPNAARVISRWYPLNERGRVQGVLLAAAQIGAVVAPTLAAYLIDGVGWRFSFLIFGLIGVAWAAGFWWWFRDDPNKHLAVNAAEAELIRAGTSVHPPDPGPIPWHAVVRNRGIATLGTIMILGSFFTYFFYTWFSKYLIDARNLENLEAGRLASLALAGSAIGVFVGGWIGDAITRHARDPVRARRYLAVVCYLSAAACLFLGVRCDDPLSLALFWFGATGLMHVTLPNWWSVAIPQCGRHVGALFGLMNGLGVVGALASQGFVGVYSDWRKGLGYEGRAQWDPIFDVYVGVLIAGAIAWWFYRVRPLPDET